MTDAIETKSEAETGGAAKAAPLLPLTVIIPVRNEAHNLRRCSNRCNRLGKFMSSTHRAPMTPLPSLSLAARRLSSSTMREAGRKSASGRWIPALWLTIGSCCSMPTRFSRRSRGGNSKGNQDQRTNAITSPAEAFLWRRLRHSGASFWSCPCSARGWGDFDAAFRIRTPAWPTWTVHEHVVVTGSYTQADAPARAP